MPEKALSDLAPFARDLAEASIAWTEQFWEDRKALIRFPGTRADRPPDKGHNIRNSVWFALGLLLRNGEGDTERACRAIGAVLDQQIDEPGAAYHGTFYRWLGEPHPGADPTMWKDFDPNWRQFIGTTLAMILDEYQGRLPPELIDRIDDAIPKAVVGEPEDRCPPGYTNIALMKAALLTYAGFRYKNPDWTRQGETFGKAVYDLFKAHNAFAEYNSPTYYGVNLYALAFWRLYAHAPALQEMGGEMEAELWRDIALTYHAGLKNVAGPYTRSYGMDMVRYGALLGMSIWMAVGRDLAPFPKADTYFEHGHDFCYGPCFGILDTIVPEDALPHFKAFSGQRQIERQITTDPKRIATAWLGETVMLGAESTGGFYRDNAQFHPATMHWKTPSGETGWMRLFHAGPVDARAERNLLTVSGSVTGEADVSPDESRSFTFRLRAPGLHPGDLRHDLWTLPGLTVRVETNLQQTAVAEKETHTEVRYAASPGDTEARFAFRIG